MATTTTAAALLGLSLLLQCVTIPTGVPAPPSPLKLYHLHLQHTPTYACINNFLPLNTSLLLLPLLLTGCLQKGMKGNQKVVSRISLVRPSTSEGSHQRAPHTQQLGLKPRATSASASTTQRSIKSLSQNHTLHSAKFMDPYNKLQTPFIPLCNQVKSRLPDPLSNAWVASPMPTSPN